MPSDIDELVTKLFKRGFSPSGIAYILRLLAAENPAGSERQQHLEVAAKDFLE